MLLSTQNTSRSNIFLGQKVFISEEFDSQRDEIKEFLQNNGCSTTFDSKNKEIIHLVKKFDGEEFELFHQLGVPIIGIPCLEDSYSLQKQLPICIDEEKTDSYFPIYGRALENFVICCHALNPLVTENIKTMIRLMNGKVGYSLSQEVTHIISENNCIDAKFDEKKWIVKPSWIYDIWQKAEYISEKDYQLKCFAGSKICVSGMTSSLKSSLKELVIENGGEFSLVLDKTCTHLVLDEPIGKKYKYAKKWNIIPLDPSWIYQCISSGYMYPVNEFLVNDKSDSYFMEFDSESSEYMNINDTITQQPEEKLMKCQDLDETVCEIDSETYSSVEVLKLDLIFSKCRLYFCNLTQSSLPIKAQKNGATIESSIGSATHVIVRRGKLSPEEDKVVKEALKIPNISVVKKNWVSDCLLMNSLVNVDHYLVDRRLCHGVNKKLLPQALLKAKLIYQSNKINHPSLFSTPQKISQTKLMSHRSLLTAMSERKKAKKKLNLIDDFATPLTQEKKYKPTDENLNDEIESSGMFIGPEQKKSISLAKEVRVSKKRPVLRIVNITENDKKMKHKDSDNDSKDFLLPLEQKKCKSKDFQLPSEPKKYKPIDDSQVPLNMTPCENNILVIPDSYISTKEDLLTSNKDHYSKDTSFHNVSSHVHIDIPTIVESSQDPKLYTIISHIYPSSGSCLGGELVFVYCNNDPYDVRVAFDDVPARTGRENHTDTTCLWALTPSKEKASIVKVTLIGPHGKCINRNETPIFFSYKSS